MKRQQLTNMLVALACFLASASCTHSAVAPTSGDTQIHLTADLSGTMVATLVVQVSAPDIPTVLVFNIPIASAVASGTITVPAGSGRSINLRAYDAGGIQTHSGSLTVDIRAGTNVTLSIVLVPLTGDIPINATLGSRSVTVTPSTATVLVGHTLTLSATIKDSDGNPVTETVAWATRDPGIAVVDPTGLVTATGTGVTSVAATFAGVEGVAVITVTP